MPIASNEISLLRSASANSLGGARTGTVAGSNLFDTVSGIEAGAGRVEYRCVYVANTDPAITLTGAVLSVQSDSSSPSTAIAVGVGTSVVNGTEQAVSGETSAPAGVSFGASANLGDIPPLGARAAWIRRTVNAGAPARQVDAATLRVAGNYTEVGEPETFFDSLTFTNNSDAPWAAQDGTPLVVSLHGSSGSNLNTGRQYRAQVSGLLAFGDYTEFAFSLVAGYVTKPGGGGDYNVTLRPVDKWMVNGVQRESQHMGFKQPDGRVHLTSERRYDLMMQWALANLGKYNLKKRVLSGGSMGGWGSVYYGVRRPDMFAAIYPDRPRWRYGNTVNTVSVPLLDGPWQTTPLASAPLLSDADGGTPYAQHVDLIAYVANPANKVAPILWCCGRQDGFALFEDQVAAVDAMRATGRVFAFAWNNGDHATGSIMRQILDSYPYGTYELGRGYPLFTQHSGDQDPKVDLEGGINIGLSFRNVVESESGWSCEVTSILGARTVMVAPVSDVFKAAASAKLVTIPAASTWVAVSFTA